MTCTNPKKRWIIGFDGIKQQEIAKITNYNTTWVYSMKGNPVYKHDVIPCGKCENCRLEHAKMWANRCVMEAKQHEYNEVLTLTYDDEHLPKVKGIDLQTGEYKFMNTLCHDDVQKFMKRLRKAYAKGQYNDIKFEPQPKFKIKGCGEYGSKYQRPHYHIIMFNFNVPDKKIGWYNEKGNPQYTSKLIESIWGKGLVTLMPVNYETCEYVCRYILKKQIGKIGKENYEAMGIKPEYTFQSNQGGIGKNYYEEKGGDSIYETQKIWIQTKKTLKQVKPPRYFDKLLEKENPAKMEEIKKARKELAELKQQILLQQTTLSYTEYLDNQQYKVKQKLNKKVRTYEADSY